MENFVDYSNYVLAAYSLTGAVTSGLALIILIKYFRRNKN